MEKVVTQLAGLGLIERANEHHFTKGKRYSEFFYLKKNIRDGATRRVSWAVWYIYGKGVDSFTASRVLEELSYSDEDYRKELEHL